MKFYKLYALCYGANMSSVYFALYTHDPGMSCGPMVIASLLASHLTQ